VAEPPPTEQSRPPEPLLQTPPPKAELWQIVGCVAGFALGYILVGYIPSEIALKVLAGSLVGIVLGLIPFAVARRADRGFAKLSVLICLAASLAGGSLTSGLGGSFLAAIPSAALSYRALRRQRRLTPP
jgi:hypothetical protein